MSTFGFYWELVLEMSSYFVQICASNDTDWLVPF